MFYFVIGGGFEPPQTPSKGVELPLFYPTICNVQG